MKLFLTLAAAGLLAVGAPAQQYDENGNDLSTLGGPITTAPGAVLQTLFGPVSPSSDISHDGQYLLLVSAYDGAAVIYLLNDSTGAVAGTVGIGSTTDFGLAWDDKRELFVTCNAGTDVIKTYTRAGALVNTWAYPATGHVGIAWDCRRDVYWVIDWSLNSVTAINPLNGAMGTSYSTSAIGCTRGAGIGYDANTDTLYMGGRDQSSVFGMYAATGAAYCSFAAQDGGNNPQGVAMSPRGGVWHSSWNSAALNELEACTPTHPEFRIAPNFPIAGGGITMTVSRLIPGERAIIAYSMVGCGPTPSPIGDILLSNPRVVIATIPSNGSGVASLSANLPGSLAGRRIFLHGGGLSGSGRFNNAILNP
ncbi:MAG: hypothetical protein O3A20_06055 [Planctomycetota bacterium]|nr:hypothetical protein [Planctomycetota bacterium]